MTKNKHLQKNSRYPRWAKIVIIGGIILIIILLGILFMLISKQRRENSSATHNNEVMSVRDSTHYCNGNNDIDKKIRKIHKSGEFQKDTSGYEYVREDFWNDTENDMPDSIVFNNIRFYSEPSYVEVEYVGDKIADDEEYSLELYKIKNITDKFSIAVKEKGTGKYCVYSMMYEEEWYYRPETFQDFLESTGFQQVIKNVSVSLYNVENGEIITYYDDKDNFKDYIMEKLNDIDKFENLLNLYYKSELPGAFLVENILFFYISVTQTLIILTL